MSKVALEVEVTLAYNSTNHDFQIDMQWHRFTKMSYNPDNTKFFKYFTDTIKTIKL